jgi:hypothetical protein
MHESHAIHLCGRRVERPGHICAFFDSMQQEYDALIPYFRDGVRAGEEVFTIVDDDRVADHTARLTDAGVAVGVEGVTIRGSDETYLADGQFEMARMVRLIEDMLTEARAKGRRVRTSGAMTWLRRNAPGTERAIEYEARMNLLVPKFDCTFMCVYDLAMLDGKTVVDIMATHPYVILRGDIRENKFYIPPDQYLRELLTPHEREQPGYAS